MVQAIIIEVQNPARLHAIITAQSDRLLSMLQRRFSQILILCLVLFPAVVCADEIEYLVTGIDEPMSTNVLNHVSAFRIGSGAKLNSRLRRRLVSSLDSGLRSSRWPVRSKPRVSAVSLRVKE
jgi:hypothetical protein